eukprot:COSAG04_NODE_1197_length_7780_cov_1.820596_8_plen_385_part_00
MSKNKLSTTIICIILFANYSFAMGDPPQRNTRKFQNKPVFKKNNKKTEINTKKTKKNTILKKENKETLVQNKKIEKEENSNIYAPKEYKKPEIDPKKNKLDKNIDKKIKEAIKRRQFSKLERLLKKIPVQALEKKEITIIEKLDKFRTIKKEENQFNKQFKSSKVKDQGKENKLTSLYNEAKGNILEGNKELAKDLLIQILYLDKSNFKARALLNKGLNLKSSDYTIENIELKFWRESEISYYSGNYQTAIKKLQALTIFDNNNALIYERLGSNYYSMTEIEKAIDAWIIAVNLDPRKKELKTFIKKAKKAQQQQTKLYKKEVKKNKSQLAPLPKIEDTILLSVFLDRASAFKFKNKIQKQNKTNKIYIYNNDNGALEVRMHKK